MGFLLKEDFGSVIDNNLIDEITEFDDNKLDTAILEAVSFMKGYLNNRYDVQAIFLATGSDRNPIIMMYCKDIVVYNLHSILNPRKIPDKRGQRYNAAVNWLNEINQMIINQPDLPLTENDNSRDYVKFGGNTKRDHHI